VLVVFILALIVYCAARVITPAVGADILTRCFGMGGVGGMVSLCSWCCVLLIVDLY